MDRTAPFLIALIIGAVVAVAFVAIQVNLFTAVAFAAFCAVWIVGGLVARA